MPPRNPNYTATVFEKARGDYVVRTNLPPDLLGELSVLVFRAWLMWALGRGMLGGKMLMHPSGQYASAITYKQTGQSVIAIFADDEKLSTPYASILETGHSGFDLKTKFEPGRVYPMHGFGRDFPAQGEYQGPGAKPGMWASNRESSFTGFAKLGKGAQSGWILPPMPAYAPAKILADLAAEAARKRLR